MTVPGIARRYAARCDNARGLGNSCFAATVLIPHDGPTHTAAAVITMSSAFKPGYEPSQRVGPS